MTFSVFVTSEVLGLSTDLLIMDEVSATEAGRFVSIKPETDLAGMALFAAVVFVLEIEAEMLMVFLLCWSVVVRIVDAGEAFLFTGIFFIVEVAPALLAEILRSLVAGTLNSVFGGLGVRTTSSASFGLSISTTEEGK